MRKTLIIFAALLVAFTGCKYEEGPMISVQSKKARMENTWDIVRATDNGQDVTDSYDNYTITLTKDGDAQLVAEYDFGSFEYSGTTNGTWEFTNEKENVKFDYEDDDADQSYQILRLTNKELWLREIGGDLELHLE